MKVRTIFEKYENSEKLQVGPTFERPGPTFPRVVRTEVKLVAKSKLLRLIRRKDIIKIAMYAAIKTFTALTVSCSMGRPFILSLTVDLG